jgi:hypothetical protein
MSEMVKRWLGGSPTYMLDVVAAADYDAAQAQADEYKREWESACERERARVHEVKELQARAEKAEYQIKVLRDLADFASLEDNRDGWMRSCEDWKERALAAEAKLAREEKPDA